MVVHVNPEDIESMVETTMVADMMLKVRVERRISWCYKCYLKGHFRTDYSPPYVKVKERQERKNVVGALLPMEAEGKQEKESETAP